MTIGLRFAGIDAAFDAVGITPRSVDVSEWNPDVGYTQIMRMLDRHPEVTAIVAANDGMAFGVYQAVAERGLRVPTDISVVSFDDEELAGYQRPGLTTARLPYDVMGRTAVGILLDAPDTRIEHSTLVQMPVIRRESVRSLA